MDPDIDTAILKVTHAIDIKIRSAAPYSKVVKIQMPIVIAGFPFYLFEDADINSVATLPLYETEEDLDSAGYFSEYSDDGEFESPQFLRLRRTVETLNSDYEAGKITSDGVIPTLADAICDYAILTALEELEFESKLTIS
jgi:hypothetical protein